MTNIPTDKDFERASKLMAERSKNLDEIRNTIKKVFRNKYPLHEIYILPQRDVDFRAYIFFEKVSDIEKCRKIGVVKEIEDFILNELERLGRGSRDEIKVSFELDSHENVEANFEGEYLLRLRR
jgi:hypothetical protein